MFMLCIRSYIQCTHKYVLYLNTYSCISRDTCCVPTDTTCIRCLNEDSIAYLTTEIKSKESQIISSFRIYILRIVFLLIMQQGFIYFSKKILALIDCERRQCYCKKFNYYNHLCIQRHVLYIHKHSCFYCVPTATSSVTTNTGCMSTDTVVYPRTHVVFVGAQHVSDV